MDKQELIKEILIYLDIELEKASDKTKDILEKLIGDRVAVLNLAGKILNFLPLKLIAFIASYTISKDK
ncbi:hypothetical protein FBF91_05930 [Campylobacter upsaliensis]|uniref:hypothetical protein n=1 Tax=Campylobacter upsaliensis TaxID=28080 RepID=UPI0012CA31D2|nr:hypothetical protein [Campylobacter upsaliensis]EAK7296549.1 hypothetical protein [Campylobacter upsaliensis]MBJ6809596.1 hypothetical protein [Campylobacter upsaliensis]